MMRVALTVPLVAVCLLTWLSVPAQAQEPAQHLQGLGPQFVVFREKVQEHLKLSDAQKEKLQERMQQVLQETMEFFQSLQESKPEEHEKKTAPYRQKAQEKLAAFLKEEVKLTPEQSKRLQQIHLQQEGLFAIGQPEIQKELKITNEQRQQFISVVQGLQKKVHPLVKEAQESGNPQEIGPKVMKLRKEHEQKIEALLTEAQKKQWKEMLGEPIKLDD